MKRIFRYLFLTLLFVCCAHTLDFYSSNDAAFSVQKINSSPRGADGSFEGSLEKTFYAVSSLIELKQEVPKKESTCQYANKALSSPTTNVRDLYHAVHIVELLGCGSKISSGANKVLQSGLNGGLEEKQMALATIKLLEQNKHNDGEADVSKVSKAVIGLAVKDGSFKGKESDTRGSPLNAGLAFDIFSKLDIEEDEVSEVTETVNVDDLLELASDSDELVFNEANPLDNLRSTVLVFEGLNFLAAKLGSSSDISVPEDAINRFAQFLISNKHATSLKDIHYLLRGLRVVSNNVFHVPLVVTLAQKSITKADNKIKIRVTDIYGRYATNAKVRLDKAYPTTNENNYLVQNQQGVADSTDQTLYVFSTTSKPEPGYYTLELTVGVEGSKAQQSHVLSIKVVTLIDVSNFEMTVADTKDEDLSTSTKITASYPHASTEVLTANLIQTIHVSFVVKAQGSNKAIRTHQAFVRFTHVDTGLEVIYATKFTDKKYELSLGMQAHAVDFKGRSGKYNVDVVIGDAFAQNPISWRVATVSINFGRLQDSFKTAEAQKGPLNEIIHQFRAPEKRPPRVVSMVFSLATLAPIAVLLIGFAAIKANVSNFPTGGNFLFAVGFQACIAAICVLYGIYWLKLNIIQTLGYLAILSVPTVFFGLRALRGVYLTRTKPHAE